ncbi:MAG: hypothetical protein H0U49_00460, partial [Parachlamydiaceae bacterium]|nr:hypothetical protein [Parachlamydiaceae bacterium]
MSAPLSSVTAIPVTSNVSSISYTERAKNFVTSIPKSVMDLVKKIFEKLNNLIADASAWCKRTFLPVSATEVTSTPVVDPTTGTTQTGTTQTETTQTGTTQTGTTQTGTTQTGTTQTSKSSTNTTPNTTKASGKVNTRVKKTGKNFTIPSKGQVRNMVEKTMRFVLPTLVPTSLVYLATNYGPSFLPHLSLQFAAVAGIALTAVGAVTEALERNTSKSLSYRETTHYQNAKVAEINAVDAKLKQLRNEFDDAKDLDKMTNLDATQKREALNRADKNYRVLIQTIAQKKDSLTAEYNGYQTLCRTIDNFKLKLNGPLSAATRIKVVENLEILEKNLHEIEKNLADKKATFTPFFTSLKSSFADWSPSSVAYKTCSVPVNLGKAIYNYYQMQQPIKIIPLNKVAAPKLESNFAKLSTFLMNNKVASGAAIVGSLASAYIYVPSVLGTVVNAGASAFNTAPIALATVTVITGVVGSTQTGRNVVSAVATGVSSLFGKISSYWGSPN